MDTNPAVIDTQTALDLGFSLCGEVEKTTAKQKYNSFVEEVQLKSIQNLVVLTEELALRGVEPGASLKTVLDIAEFNFKASGMAAKQTAAVAGTGAFSVVIHLPGQDITAKHLTPKTVEGTVIECDPPPLQTPEFTQSQTPSQV